MNLEGMILSHKLHNASNETVVLITSLTL